MIIHVVGASQSLEGKTWPEWAVVGPKGKAACLLLLLTEHVAVVSVEVVGHLLLLVWLKLLLLVAEHSVEILMQILVHILHVLLQIRVHVLHLLLEALLPVGHILVELLHLGLELSLGLLGLGFHLLQQLQLLWLQTTHRSHHHLAVPVDEGGHVLVDKQPGQIVGQIGPTHRQAVVAVLADGGSVIVESGQVDVAPK